VTKGFGFGALGLRRSYAGPSDGDVAKGRGWAVRIVFANHLGCEVRVVGKPSIGDDFVKGLVGGDPKVADA
jgi:hypothetical protein